MPDGSEESDYVYLLEALCMWKMSPNILQLCSDWLEDSLTPSQHTPSAAPGEPKKKGSKKCVQIMAPASQQRPQMALNYIQALLRSSVCKHILTDNHRPLLLTLNRLLSHVMAVLEQQLEGSVDRDMATLTSTAFSLHLRLSVLLHQQEAEDGPDCVNKMLAILKMGEEKLAPLLRHPAAVKRENDGAIGGDIGDGGDDKEEQKKGKGKKEGGKAVEEENGESLAEACVKVTLTVCSNMLMLGVGNQDLMTQLLSFCKCVLNSNPDLLVIESVAGCLLQLTLFEQLESDRHVTDVMSLVMLALNTHLHGNVEADSKVVSGLRNKLYEIVSAILERHHSKQASPTDIGIVTDLTSTMMSAVLQELKYGSKHDSLPSVVDKKTTMPPLTGVVLASFSRNVLCRRSFVGELEKCVASGAVTDVHTTHAVVHLLLIVQSKGTYCKGVDLGSVTEATRKLVTHISCQASDTMEEDVDVFRDVISTVQDKLKRGTGQAPA